jgi:hypothetical protein
LDLEQTFAAEVLNARGNAKFCNTTGFPQTVSDQVDCTLMQLWENGRAADMASADIQAIADRWVEWDVNDQPAPRSPDSNVLALRR